MQRLDRIPISRRLGQTRPRGSIARWRCAGKSRQLISDFTKCHLFNPFAVRCNLSQNSGLPEHLGCKMFILGMGFVGRFFAAGLKARGWAVSGSCTSVAKKNELEKLGYESYLFDANDPRPEILEIVKNHTHLVVSIPPVAGLRDPINLILIINILRCSMIKKNCGHFKGWETPMASLFINHEYPIRTMSERIIDRLSAEEQWLSLGRNLGIAAQVFRLGGIYGPGRSAIATILKQKPQSFGQNTRMYKNYTSRVHVADVCQALNASILRHLQGRYTT